MKTPHEYRRERQALAETLKQFNNRACIHFAGILRMYDEYQRMSMELGEKPEELIPVAYFEAVYRILSFAPESKRLTLMAGTSGEIDKLVSEVQAARGFYDENNFWVML